MRHPKPNIFFVISFMILFNYANPFAFGEMGHRLVAAIAQDFLNPKAKQEVEKILATAGNGGPAPSLEDISIWADEIRYLRRTTGPWHYITIQISALHYNPSITDTPNVVTALSSQIELLKNPKGNRYIREEALKWVVHLTGDLHQPLHVGEDHDKGGNFQKVKLNRRSYNLHAVYDKVLIERMELDERTLHQRLWKEIQVSPIQYRGAAAGTLKNWVEETHLKSRDCYLQFGKPLPKGIKVGLDKEYVDAATRRILEQLKIGGIRLAFLLNKSLDPSGPALNPQGFQKK